MLYYAALFFVVAMLSGFLGFFGVSGIAAAVARILFVIFLILFIASLVFDPRRKRRGPPL
ncbi:MAG TPA: DUF1328 domain-containing protein [Nevskiaceae bacterium]